MHPSASPQPPDRAAINRENAQHSTGPITPEGKANVKLNALRHGACAQQIVLPGEDQDAYEALGRDLDDYWQPVSTHERKLVRTLQENEWRLARLRAAETNLWSLGIIEQLENFAQYDEPTRLAFAQAAAFRANAKHFDQIGRHERRIDKLSKETEDELREEIRNRTDNPAAAERERVIATFDPMKPQPSATPSGFVLQTEANSPATAESSAAPDEPTLQKTAGAK